MMFWHESLAYRLGRRVGKLMIRCKNDLLCSVGQAEALGRYAPARGRSNGSKVSPNGLLDPQLDQPSPFANHMDGKQDMGGALGALSSVLKSAGSRGSAEMPKVMSMSIFPPLPQVQFPTAT